MGCEEGKEITGNNGRISNSLEDAVFFEGMDEIIAK